MKQSHIIVGVLLFVLLSNTLLAQNITRYRVIDVNNAFYNNNPIQNNDTLPIVGKIPPQVNNYFFDVNNIEIQKNGWITLSYQGKRRVLKYEDYINVQTIFPSHNTNTISRGRGNIDNYTCNDSLSDSKFKLLSIVNTSIEFWGLECLRLYFSTGAYWLNLSDTLSFKGENEYCDGLLFQNEDMEISFIKKNNRIIVESKDLPEDQSFFVYRLIDGDQFLLNKVGKVRVINAPKIIKRAKEENFSQNEAEELMITYYLNDKFSNNSFSERILSELHHMVSIIYEED